MSEKMDTTEIKQQEAANRLLDYIYGKRNFIKVRVYKHAYLPIMPAKLSENN